MRERKGPLIGPLFSNSLGNSPAPRRLTERPRPRARPPGRSRSVVAAAADIVLHYYPRGRFLFPSEFVAVVPIRISPGFSPIRDMSLSLSAVSPRRISRRRGSLIYKVLCRDTSDLARKRSKPKYLPSFPLPSFLPLEDFLLLSAPPRTLTSLEYREK